MFNQGSHDPKLKRSEGKAPGLSERYDHHSSSPLDALCDADLWNEFKKGNRSAFIYIYNRHFDELFKYALQFTKDADLIKDCIQDVFVRLNDTKQRLSATSSIKYYLFKSIKREVIHALKHRKYSASQLEKLEGRQFAYEVSVEEVMISRQIDEDTRQSLRDAANKLNNRQREIIFYHFFENFSLKEIQELMDFNSAQATHNLLNRALKHLREILSLLALLCLLG